MTLVRNNYVFKGHKSLLGSKYVTYGELELPTRNDIYKSSESFDWGHTGPAARQLGFSMLCQLSDKDFAEEYALRFTHDIIRELGRDWIIKASDVSDWIKKHSAQEESLPEIKSVTRLKKNDKKTTSKINVVKEVCNELQITQKNLANILEVPEGTVSSWAVKNEIPRLGKKAIEFYIQSRRNQEIVDSYKSFVNLLHAS